MDKKAFSLLEVTISMFIMGLTITALLNLLDWSNLKYKASANSWKERNCFTETRIWLRNQILKNKNHFYDRRKIFSEKPGRGQGKHQEEISRQ